MLIHYCNKLGVFDRDEESMKELLQRFPDSEQKLFPVSLLSVCTVQYLSRVLASARDTSFTVEGNIEVEESSSGFFIK